MCEFVDHLLHFGEVVGDEDDVVRPDEVVAFSSFNLVACSFFSPFSDGFVVYVVYDGVEFIRGSCAPLPAPL